MKIAILSDIHDNIWNVAAAKSALLESDAMICCGDLCSPFIVGMLAEGYEGREIHIVFGNNDGDLFRITQNASKFPNVHLHGAFFANKEPMGGKYFAVNHYPDIALPIAQAGRHDVVCYGHDHAFKIASEGDTLTINSGTLMGYNPVKKQIVPATFVIYDTDTNQAAGYQIANPSGSGAGTGGVIPYS
jgi:uncharacterized protein